MESGSMRSVVFGASLWWVEATAHLDRRLGSKESNPKFQILALKCLSQSLLLEGAQHTAANTILPSWGSKQR